MPKLVCSSQLIVHRLINSVNRKLITVNCKSKGFTLIELLVVITIFGIITSLITASYVTFERGQRLRNAAETLKSDIRLVQNKALSGDKSTVSNCVEDSNTKTTLIGWYLVVDNEATGYTISSDCVKIINSAPPVETAAAFKTLT